MNEPQPTPASWWPVVGLALYVLGLPPLVYAVVVWGADLPGSDQGVPWGYRGLGAGLSSWTAMGVSLMGENLIEDIVKVVMVMGPALVFHLWDAPILAAISLGPAIGAGLPFLTRLLQAIFGRA